MENKKYPNAEKSKSRTKSKQTKISRTIIPTLKQKKRFVLFRMGDKPCFEEFYLSVKSYFGLQKLAESGLMHLKELDFSARPYSYYVFKINPKFLELLYQSVVFTSFDIDIVKVFGNVRKLKEFAKDKSDEIEKNLKNNFDVFRIPKNSIKTISELEDAFKHINQSKKSGLKYLVVGLEADLALSMEKEALDSLLQKYSKDMRFVFYVASFDGIRAISKLYDKDKLELPYFWSFSSYEDINLVDAYKNARVKPFAVFSLESNKKSDFLRFRNSNMNDVTAKFFAEKKVFYGLDLSLIWNAQNKNVVLGRVFQNLRLCKQFKVPVVVASLSRFDDVKTKNPRNVARALESFKLTELMFEDIFV